MVNSLTKSLKLYRYFILVAFAFVTLTLVLQRVPKFYIVRNKDSATNCEQKINNAALRWPGTNYEHWNRESQRQLPFVWDSLNGKDRIVEQIDYVPSGLPEKIEKPKIIWTRGSFDVPMGEKVFETCRVKHCSLATDEVSHIDARMFNLHFSSIEATDMSSSRRPDEIWILYALEGPLASPDYFLLDNTFNWTATYRLDSTIVTPYEKWHQTSSTALKRASKNYALGKNQKVAMFVSNCDTTNGRLKYVQELQKYIDVHVYGACGDGTYNCDRHVNETACMEILKKNYKFYLAFENSNCRHYITEKFFRNGLMSDVVPVVMGAHPVDYRRVAPPNSYIHVADFESPKDLAEYLHHVDKNDDLYNKYFEWKSTGSFIDTKFWCRLCSMLNDPNKPELIIDSLMNWWRPPGVCLREDQRWF